MTPSPARIYTLRRSLSSCSGACIKKSSSRRANTSRNRQGGGAADVLDAAWRAVASLGPLHHRPRWAREEGRDGFALQDENRHSEDSPPDPPASRGRAAEG